MRFIAALIILLNASIAPQIVHAQSAPLPPNKKEQIGQLDQKLADEKNKEKALSQKVKTIEKDLQSTKKGLVKTAKSVQKNEQELGQLDDKIKDLESKQVSIRKDLEKDRGSIAKLILALERIRRLPPEAMIAQPETPLKTAQSAMLMQQIIPALDKQAASLKEKLAELDGISKDLKDKRAAVLKTAKILKDEQKTLNALVDKRTALYASTQTDLKSRQQAVERISSQAKNLQDLVKKLDAEEAKKKAAAKAKPKNKRVVTASIPKAGQPRLPLYGPITIGYNEPDNFGAPSSGIDIEGRAGALIVAPMGGVIRFAGHFKNYGNMVIIEHKGEWHSLVAGLEKLDTVVGQSVDAGEPLGVLHKSSSGGKPTLYYELRHKGKAVNPAKKIADLS